MLRAAAVASLGLRRLAAASTTTAAVTGSQPSLLLKFVPAPAASPVRRLLPTLDLSRGYARGRQSSFSDGDDDGDDFYDSFATGRSGYYDSDMDGNGMDDGRWDDDSE